MGRQPRRLRTLLIVLVILVLLQGASLHDIPRSHLKDLAAVHQSRASSYQAASSAPIVKDGWGWASRRDPQGPRRIEWHLSEAQIEQARQERAQSARRAAFHAALSRKYSWLAWVPWLPVPPEPPEPD